MDSCDFVHSIELDKTNSITRHKLFTNVAKLFQMMEVFIVLVFISWSSTRLPLVFKISVEYLLAFTSYLMNQHVVFLVGNVIVLVCYILSRYTECGNEAGCYQVQHDFGKTAPYTLNSKLVPLQVDETLEKDRKDEKPIIETEIQEDVKAVATIKRVAKQMERFRRTQSNLKSKISVKPHVELRRSVTERRQSRVDSCPTVDELSNEEFRIAVERFISKQQRFLKQQSLVQDGS